MIKKGNQFLDRSYTSNLKSIHDEGVLKLEKISAKLIAEIPFQRGPATQFSYNNCEEAKNRYNTGIGQNTRMIKEIKTYREVYRETAETRLKYQVENSPPVVIPEVIYNVIHVRYNE